MSEQELVRRYPDRRLQSAVLYGLGSAMTLPFWLGMNAGARLRRAHPGAVSAIPVIEATEGEPDLRAIFAATQPVIIGVPKRYLGALTPARVRAVSAQETLRVYTSSDPELVFHPGDGMMKATGEEAYRLIFEAAPGPIRYHVRNHGKILEDVTAFRVDGHTYDRGSSAVWMSQAGHLTPLHADPWHGLLYQCAGDKEVVLFSPEEIGNLHMDFPLRLSPAPANYRWASYSDYLTAPRGRYPLLDRAHAHRGVLRPGYMLYVPPMWWHQVRSVDNAMSLALRYSSSRAMYLNPSHLAVGFLYLGTSLRVALFGTEVLVPRKDANVVSG